MEIFSRESEAWEYVKSIPDDKERLLAEVALANALSFLVLDSEYQVTWKERPVDLMFYARMSHALLRQMDVLRNIFDGVVSSIDDLDPFRLE